MTESRYDEYGYKKRSKKKSARPLLITVLCLILFAFGLWEIVYSFTGNVALHGGVDTLYPAVNSLMMVFGFIGLSGTWSMEKWGPVSFVIVLALKIVVDLLFGHFNWLFLLGFIPAVIFLMTMPKMRRTE